MALPDDPPKSSKPHLSHRRSVTVATLGRPYHDIFRARHRLSSSTSSPELSTSFSSSRESLAWSESSSDAGSSLTPTTEDSLDGVPKLDLPQVAELDKTKSEPKRVLTKLLTQDPEILRKSPKDGESGTQLIQKYCCGGGCCFLNQPLPSPTSLTTIPIEIPNNEAFRSLGLKLPQFSLDTELNAIPPLPENTLSFQPATSTEDAPTPLTIEHHPPEFVQPHYPYHVFSAPLYHTRELTKPGALKRTFHFDIDVTDYPEEGDVDFKVGGAVGISPSNEPSAVEDIFNILCVPKHLRGKPLTLVTTGGRWPTVWGEESPRSLLTTRQELLTWCTDIQSYPPTKNLLRLMAEHAIDTSEKKILLYLSSAQGQPSFCNLRTGSHLSLTQLLNAFPSSKPPLPDLLAVQSQLMPRFYSLSNDPHVSSSRDGLAGRRLIEVAVTVHETPNWSGGERTGVGSGFLERQARRYIDAEEAARAGGMSGSEAAQHARATLDLRIPLFRGLMANPLSREFGTTTGPMMLIGAGVGMAPFRGFILNRLRDANCASKIWLVQGVRDSSLDELYSGELGAYESQIKRVVQSRRRRKMSMAAPRAANSEADLPSLLARSSNSRDTSSAKDSDQLEKRDSQVTVVEPSAQSEHRPSGQWKTPTTDSKYVQDEVRAQGDVVWDVINAVDGRIFVCGSSQGMGEGVESALRDVAVAKGPYDEEGADNFWKSMKEAKKLVVETW